jgi:hypothetical protein
VVNILLVISTFQHFYQLLCPDQMPNTAMSKPSIALSQTADELVPIILEFAFRLLYVPHMRNWNFLNKGRSCELLQTMNTLLPGPKSGAIS